MIPASVTDVLRWPLVEAAAGLLLVWAAVRLIRYGMARRSMDNDTRYRWRKLVNFAGVLLAGAVLLVAYNERLGNVSVALGVAGAGIAFALQEVIASVAGWLAIWMAGFYRTGDRVQLGGIAGDVIDIGVLRTTIMEVGRWVDGDLYNGRIVRVANSFVFKEPVFNYSGDFPFLWDEVKVPVMYGSDYAAARAMFERVLLEVCGDLTDNSRTIWRGMVNKFLIEDARTSPWVTLAFNDNWVEFTLRYVVGYKNRRAVKDALFTRLLQEIEADATRIRLGSTTLQLVPSVEQ